jgi:hypothetical protein
MPFLNNPFTLEGMQFPESVFKDPVEEADCPFSVEYSFWQEININRTIVKRLSNAVSFIEVALTVNISNFCYKIDIEYYMSFVAVVGLIYLGSLGSFFWLDLIYGIEVAVGLPKLLIRLLS